jgi:hypothetical protein
LPRSESQKRGIGRRFQGSVPSHPHDGRSLRQIRLGVRGRPPFHDGTVEGWGPPMPEEGSEAASSPEERLACWKRRIVVRGFPLIHNKTVDEWGTALLGCFMTGPPALRLTSYSPSRSTPPPVQVSDPSARSRSWPCRRPQSPACSPAGCIWPRPLAHRPR